MGEYLSAIVADSLEIPLMKSNDHLFRDGERGKDLYPDLVVKNWEDTLRDLLPYEDIGKVREKVRVENNNMNKEKQQYEKGQATIEDIRRLQERFNNKF